MQHESAITRLGVIRLGGWAALASGAIGAVGLAFLIAMYASFAVGSSAALPFGRINDFLVLIQYLVALPITLALQVLLGPRNPSLIRAATVIGIVGMFAIAGLQFLLVAGVLTFAQQVVPVMIAILVVGVWLVITGSVGQAGATLPGGLRMSLLAAPYLGYPIWAFWLGRRLLAMSASERRTGGAVPDATS
jgi:hypothetical protein